MKSLLFLLSILHPSVEESYYHFLLGYICETSGYLQDAISEYKATISANPDAISVYKDIANVYLKLGEYESSKYYADIFLNSSVDNYEAYLLLGQINYFSGNIDESIKNFEDAIKLHPEDYKIILEVARLYIFKDKEKSISFYKRYIEAFPDDIDVLLEYGEFLKALKNYEESTDIFRKVYEKNPNEFLALIELADIYETSKKYDKAIDFLNKALNLSPDNIIIKYHLGRAYFENRDFIRSEIYFYNLLRYIEDIEIYLWLGWIYEEKGLWDLSAKQFKKIIDLLKENTPKPIFVRLSYFYSKQGKTKQAIKVLEKAKKIFKEDCEIIYLLGLAYLDLNKISKAIKCFRDAIQLKEDFTDAMFHLAVALDQNKKFDEAEKIFQKILDLDSQYTLALNYLGYTYALHKKNLKKAEQMLQKALDLESENGAYHDSLGWIYFTNNQTDKAIEELEIASKLIRDEEIFQHLGDAYSLNKENYLKAWLNYKKAYSILPKKALKQKINFLETNLSLEDRVKKTVETIFENLREVESIISYCHIYRNTPPFFNNGILFLGKEKTIFYDFNSLSETQPSFIYDLQKLLKFQPPDNPEVVHKGENIFKIFNNNLEVILDLKNDSLKSLTSGGKNIMFKGSYFFDGVWIPKEIFIDLGKESYQIKLFTTIVNH